MTSSQPQRLSVRPKAEARIAVVVNANAKRGGRRIGVELARALPFAEVVRTRSAEELEAWLKESDLDRYLCIFAAGGDGTAVGLINALDRVVPKDRALPTLGFLPLGTGNSWARTVGARKLGYAVKWLNETNGTIERFPTRRFGLVEAEGKLTCFAGSGWDSYMINDFQEQARVAKGPAKEVAKSVYGYLSAMVLRTIPRSVVQGRPSVIVENLGDEVFKVRPDGQIVKLEGAGRGAVLFDGPIGVSGVATIPEYGYGFRAFPNAERFLGMMNVRVYDESAIRAAMVIPRLWRGDYMPGMHDWFMSACRMTYSRPVPYQTAGDASGIRQTVEYRLSKRTVDVLHWRALG